MDETTTTGPGTLQKLADKFVSEPSTNIAQFCQAILNAKSVWDADRAEIARLRALYEGENARWHSFETVQAIVKELDEAKAEISRLLELVRQTDAQKRAAVQLIADIRTRVHQREGESLLEIIDDLMRPPNKHFHFCHIHRAMTTMFDGRLACCWRESDRQRAAAARRVAQAYRKLDAENNTWFVKDLKAIKMRAQDSALIRQLMNERNAAQSNYDSAQARAERLAELLAKCREGLDDYWVTLEPETVKRIDAALAQPDTPKQIIEGTLSANDIRRAFVAGAKWWEWNTQNATMWQSDRNLAEAEAERRYPGGKLPAQPDAGDGGPAGRPHG